MKKLLSILLCAVLLVSCGTFAFSAAAEGEEAGAVCGAELKGYQVRTDGTGIRIVAEVTDIEAYREIGLVMSDGTTTVRRSATMAFKKLTAASEDGDTYTALEAAEGNYLYALTIESIPTGADLTLTFSPYTVTQEGVTADGEARTLTKKAGETWQAEKSKVTLTNLTTADIVDETNYHIGGTYTKPADPVREGYTFGGWYNAADNTPYDFSSALTGELTLYARWLVPDDTRAVVVTANEVKNSLTLNWGVVNTKDYGRGFLYSSFGETELYRFKEGVKIGNEGLTQLWTLPKINFNLYSKLEFALSKNGGVGTLGLLGQTFTSPSGSEQNHLLFSFSDGKLNIYGINNYAAPIATLTVPEAILNGSEAMTIQLACTSGELLVTEFIAESRYKDYVATAVSTDAVFAAWCNSNIGNPSAMTDEQKAEFAKQLNTLSIARASMTDYEQKKFPMSGIITYISRTLAAADDAWFNLFGVDDIVFGKLYRDAENDKTDQAVKNAVYGAKNQTDKVNYYAFVTDGAQTDPGVFTLPKINFRALGLTLSFNVCSGGSTKISFDGKDGGDFSTLTSNPEWCYVVSVYAEGDAWYIRLHSDRGSYEYKVALTEAQITGQEAITCTVTPASPTWYRLLISDISATF